MWRFSLEQEIPEFWGATINMQGGWDISAGWAMVNKTVNICVDVLSIKRQVFDVCPSDMKWGLCDVWN